MNGPRPTVYAGRYRVIRRLGTAGTGAVFLALDDRLEREVALKRLHGAEVTEQTAHRLRREARIMASLRHRNLLTVFDMLMDEDDLLLVMEYIRGHSLADELVSAPLGLERTVELLEPVAAALDHVHGQGVVHRDLKPSNILIGPAGVVKVADLGLATAAEITRITPPGAVLGTPSYMAPEQARAGPCTAAVDVYSLATIAFQAISGTLPRTGRTVGAVLAQATREPPPDLRERRPDTPAAAAEVLMRGMSPRPEDRQRSASQLLQELNAACRTGSDETPTVADEAVAPTLAWVGDGGTRAHASRSGSERPSTPRPRSEPTLHRRRRLRRRVVALAALAAGAVAVLGLVAVSTPERQRSPASAQQTPPTRPTPTQTSTSAPTRQAASTATPATPRALSATATVRAFYRRAAAGDYAAAWKLAGPGMRAAFGNSFERFRSNLSSLRRVEFQRVAVQQRSDASVTMAIQSIATHDDRVDHCSGTLRTVRDDAGHWLVEPAGIHCTSG